MPPSQRLPTFELYAEQLLPLNLGFALYEPDPGRGRSEVRVGDIGFVYDGRFRRVASVFEIGNGVTSVLEERFHETEQFADLDKGILSSKSVRNEGFEGVLSGGEPVSGSSIGLSVKFTCSSEKGAMLFRKCRAVVEKASFPIKLRQHFATHLHSVYDFAKVNGYVEDMHNITLVMGRIMTGDWATLVFHNDCHDNSASFDVEAATITAKGTLWGRWSEDVNFPRRHGPPRVHAIPHDREPDFDQCVFIETCRYFDLSWFNRLKITIRIARKKGLSNKSGGVGRAIGNVSLSSGTESLHIRGAGEGNDTDADQEVVLTAYEVLAFRAFYSSDSKFDFICIDEEDMKRVLPGSATLLSLQENIQSLPRLSIIELGNGQVPSGLWGKLRHEVELRKEREPVDKVFRLEESGTNVSFPNGPLAPSESRANQNMASIGSVYKREGGISRVFRRKKNRPSSTAFDLSLVSRRRSISDPFNLAMMPPANEQPAARNKRIILEQAARQRSDEIDKQIKRERAATKPAIKVLLLGQGESGKSTLLKQFQLLYSPVAFHQVRMAWRFIIYLNVIRSVRRILDAFDPAHQPTLLSSDNGTKTAHIPPTEPLRLLSPSSPNRSSNHDYEDNSFLAEGSCTVPNDSYFVYTTEESEDEAEDNSLRDRFDRYTKQLAPLFTLEHHLNHRFSLPVDEGDLDRAAQGLPSFAPKLSSGELTLRKGFDWEKTFSSPDKPQQAYSVIQSAGSPGCWEDSADPVHVFHFCTFAEDGVIALWQDRDVRTVLERKRVRMEESSGFFLNDLERIAGKSYIPQDDDILRARLKTVGVTEHTFKIKGSEKFPEWKVFDVGGTRSQRHAWAPYFENVNAVIFLAPISAFDQTLAESPHVNRLEDSLSLWRAVASNKFLTSTSIILFLNKCDLLRAKLEAGVMLSSYMPAYGQRSNDYENVSKFLRHKFSALHAHHTPNPDRELWIHLTSVTDRRTTHIIIGNVRDLILRENLNKSRLF